MKQYGDTRVYTNVEESGSSLLTLCPICFVKAVPRGIASTRAGEAGEKHCPNCGHIHGRGTKNTKVLSMFISAEDNTKKITTAGGTLQMNAYILPSIATQKKVAWSVVGTGDTKGSAIINDVGLLTALHDGDGVVTVTASATDGSNVVSEGYEVTISNQTKWVTGISISGAGDAIIINTAGGTLQMSAVVTPVDATVDTVTWVIAEGADFATISEGGLLSAVADGVVTVTASATDGSNVVSEGYEVTISNQT